MTRWLSLAVFLVLMPPLASALAYPCEGMYCSDYGDWCIEPGSGYNCIQGPVPKPSEYCAGLLYYIADSCADCAAAGVSCDGTCGWNTSCPAERVCAIYAPSTPVCSINNCYNIVYPGCSDSWFCDGSHWKHQLSDCSIGSDTDCGGPTYCLGNKYGTKGCDAGRGGCYDDGASCVNGQCGAACDSSGGCGAGYSCNLDTCQCEQACSPNTPIADSTSSTCRSFAVNWHYASGGPAYTQLVNYYNTTPWSFVAQHSPGSAARSDAYSGAKPNFGYSAIVFDWKDATCSAQSATASGATKADSCTNYDRWACNGTYMRYYCGQFGTANGTDCFRFNDSVSCGATSRPAQCVDKNWTIYGSCQNACSGGDCLSCVPPVNDSSCSTPCGAACGSDADCTPTCAAGNTEINASGACTGSCSCSFQTATCESAADSCKEVTCGGTAYYCTNATGSWKWSASKLCDDLVACSYDSFCHGGTQTAGGVCGYTLGNVANYTCGDVVYAERLNVNRTCNGGLDYSSCSAPAFVFNCADSTSPDNFTMCWRQAAGGKFEYNNVFDGTGLDPYYCTNFSADWAWRSVDRCWDGNLCTADDSCQSYYDSFVPDAPQDKCAGASVESGGRCVESHGFDWTHTPQPDLFPLIVEYGTCCYFSGEPADNDACQNDTSVDTHDIDPECAKISCISHGQVGWDPQPDGTACGAHSCAPGTVPQGDCEKRCYSGKCEEPTNCQCIVTGETGKVEMVAEAPLTTRDNETIFTLTTYFLGKLDCSHPTLVVYDYGEGAKRAPEAAPCSGGRRSYVINTTKPGVYVISSYYDAGLDGTIVKTSSMDRVSEQKPAKPAPELNALLVPIVAALALLLARKRS